MRRLLAARHGESELSAKALVNGDPGVACPLTELGRVQAQALATALADERIDLCVVTEFERVRETAEIALAGRDIPFLVLPELNDPRYGEFEGGSIVAYREWVWARGPLDAPAGGEHRGDLAGRYGRGLRILADRPEDTILLVAHSLPLAYLRDAAAGTAPRSRMEMVEYAQVVRLDLGELEQAVAVLDAWAAAPAF